VTTSNRPGFMAIQSGQFAMSGKGVKVPARPTTGHDNASFGCTTQSFIDPVAWIGTSQQKILIEPDMEPVLPPPSSNKEKKVHG